MPQSTSTVELVTGFFLVCAALIAAFVLLRPIYLPVWHLFRRTQQFLEDWFGEPADDRRGTPERKGAMARLAQLENNGGGTMRDKVDQQAAALSKLQHDVTNIRASLDILAPIQGTVEVLKGYAERNKGLAEAASSAAQVAADKAEAGRAVAERIEHDRRRDVDALQHAMETMREDVAADAAQRDALAEEKALERMAEAYGLLAEVTAHRTDGPIIMPMPGTVPPHKHELPKREQPTMTSGPVEPEE